MSEGSAITTVVSERAVHDAAKAAADALNRYAVVARLERRDLLSAFFHAYTGLPLKNSSVVSYGGAKEVHTVVVQHPDYKPARGSGRRR